MRASLNPQLHALGFVYDRMPELPIWIRKLTPGQIEDVAALLIAWDEAAGRSGRIVSLDEVEKREITRAISLCQGDIGRAAKALQVGKTTIYRKLKKWGCSMMDGQLVHQASALAKVSMPSHRTRPKSYFDSQSGR